MADNNALNNASSILNVDNLRLDGNTLSSTDTNGDIVIAPNGTGTVSITAAPIVPTDDRADSLGSATNSWDDVFCDGLTFNDGTNLLATYQTGTWTPAITFNNLSVGITYTNQLGKYTRIGDIVFITFEVTLSNKGSSTGGARVTGFPFSGSSTAPVVNLITGNVQNITIASGDVVIFDIGSVTTLNVRAYNGTTAITYQESDFTNTSRIRATGFYVA